MAQWDEFGKKLDKFARSASRKSSRIVEAAKLNAAINRLELEIEDIQFELGKAYYEAHAKAPEPEFVEYIGKINGLAEEILQLNKRRLAFKGLQICPACSSTEPLNNEFCGKCGGRLGGYREEPHCAHCGATLSAEDDTCPECGRSQAAEPGEPDEPGETQAGEPGESYEA